MVLDILASGSSANCALVRGGNATVLVDCGLMATEALKALAALGVAPEDVTCCLGTHEHQDHARGIPLLASRLGIPVYAQAETLKEIKWGRFLLVKTIPITPHEWFEIGDLRCYAFPVPHDAPNVAFIFEDPSKDSLIIATDLGSIPEELAEAMRKVDTLMIESNFDESVIVHSEYPSHLKKRITGGWGHLSNGATMALLRTLKNGVIKRIALGHISRQNNSKDLVKALAEEALREAGIETLLEVV